MQAALGLAQLERIEELVARKREIFGWYRDRLGGEPGADAEQPRRRTSRTPTGWSPRLRPGDRPRQAAVLDGARAGRASTAGRSSIRSARCRPTADQPAGGRGRAANPVAYDVAPRAVNLPSGLQHDARAGRARLRRRCGRARGSRAAWALVSSPLVVWGGTGQAKVVADPRADYELDRGLRHADDVEPPVPGVPLYRGRRPRACWARDQASRRRRSSRSATLAGRAWSCTGCSPARLRAGHRSRTRARTWPTRPSGRGSQILAGAVVGVGAELGEGASSTRARASTTSACSTAACSARGDACGLVQVDVNGWICAGATVLPRVRIGAEAIVGAGAVVTRDVPAG